MSLADREIRNISPTSKVQRYYDECGLYLEVAPGGGKWWRFNTALPARRNAFLLAYTLK